MAAINLRPVLGAKPDGKTGHRFLLVCYFDPNGISTIYEHVRLWQKFSLFPIQVLNLWPRTPLRIPAGVDLNDFAGVILHPTVGYFPTNLTGLDADLRTPFAAYKGVKVLVKQDEHFRTAAYPKFIADNGFDVLVTCVPPGELEKVYPREVVGNIEVVHALTGYVSDHMRALDHRRGSTPRPTDICYRGSLQPLSVGRLGYEKRQIGSAVYSACQDKGLSLDISSRWEDRVFGTAWFDFLAQSNAVLGVESGSNLFDYDGGIFDWCSEYERENKSLDPYSDEYYLKAHKEKLKDYEGNVNYGQISPRHFEAAATRTVQVMYEGEYSGIFQAGRHFIPLKRDLSNLEAVLDLLRDPAACQRMTDAAFEEIILNPDYHYRAFVERTDIALQTVLERKGAAPKATPEGAGDRPRAAYIMSHDPVIDPRVTWMANSLAETYEICEVGCHNLPGSGPVVQQIGPHHTRLVVERSRHSWDWLHPMAFGDDAMPGLSELLRLHVYRQLEPHELARQIGALGATDEDLTRFRWYLNYFVNTNGALYQAVRNSGDFELVVATDLDTLPTAIALGRLYSCPVVYDAHEYWPFSSLSFSSWESEFWAGLEKRLSGQADVRVSVSAPLAQHMSQEYGVDFITVPNATPMAPLPGRISKLAGEHDLVVLVQGNFAPGRGYERLIEAWPLVNPGIHLALRGPDCPYKKTIMDLAASMGLAPDRISFPPPLPPDQMVEGAADADIAVVPYEPTAITYRLACPNKFSEYLAAGRPILSNQLDFLTPMIEDNQLGQVVNFSDPIALSGAINALAADPERLSAMGRRARAFFESSYNWEQASHDLFSRIAEMIRSPAADARPLNFEWVHDLSEMRVSSASALTRSATDIEQAGPEREKEFKGTERIVKSIPLSALQTISFWEQQGAGLEAINSELRLTTPPIAWHYAAMAKVDWSGIDLAQAVAWVQLSCRNVRGDIRAGLFDPVTNEILAEVQLPAYGGDVAIPLDREGPWQLLLRTGDNDKASSVDLQEINLIARAGGRPSAPITPGHATLVVSSDMRTIAYWEQHGAEVRVSTGAAHVKTPPVAWHYAAVADLPFQTAGETTSLEVLVRDVCGEAYVAIYEPLHDRVIYQSLLQPNLDPQTIFLEMKNWEPATSGLQLMIRTGSLDASATVGFISAEFVNHPPPSPTDPERPEQLTAAAASEAESPTSQDESGPVTDLQTSKYWTDHNVTLHRRYASSDESLSYFHWRNDQYIDYISLMPVEGYDGKVVLDYGCGPGHDLVGFGHYSKPKKLIGADVSASSLREAADRLSIHGIQAQLIHLDVSSPRLPFDDESIDHIHSSGVIHHAPDPLFILKELRRILKPGGTMNVMVYNYDSLWFHLYVAYIKRITEGLYEGLSPREAFTKSTDGPDCPISNAYRPQEWIELCSQAGLTARFTGAAISLWEASLAPRRFEACMNERLGVEHRDFLLGLSVDPRGLPLHNGSYAGVDGCYEITRR